MGEKESFLGQRIRSGTHRDNGFDTIRLAAATLVLVSHSFPLTVGSNAWEPVHMLTNGQATLGMLSVAAFFVISGLLISNSFEASSSVYSFALKRVLRIMPALVMLCAISILVIGPLFTSLPLQQYSTNPKSWSFAANALFLPHDYRLPGVFEDRFLPNANGSIWTLKFEVACYVFAAVALMWPRIWLVGLAWLGSFVIARMLNGGEGSGGALFYLGAAAHLFRFFGAGMMLYLLRERLPLRRDWAVYSGLACLAAIPTPFFVEATATLGAYALIVFAYECPAWVKNVTRKGDISYGVYVYAWPIQQILAPLSFGLAAGWFLNVALALPLTFLAGLMSWLFVEKPALTLKRRRTRHSAESGKQAPSREEISYQTPAGRELPPISSN